jgi:c-di-GMP-binding flagellar brake protein YcgR
MGPAMFQDTQPAALDPEGGLDDWAQFRVDDGSELLRLLKQLRDGSVPVTLSAPSSAAVNSQLWSVDAVQRQISFSADADSVHMQRLAQDDEAVAVAYLDNVKLQFELCELVLVRAAASCALRARLPAVLYRFQRRASYRVRTFDRRAPQALLRHPSMPDMRIKLRIVDLSAGGCALLLPDDIPALQPGAQLAGVRIELDGDTTFDATLRLQHVSAMYGGGSGQRLGCEFVELGGQAQRVLQRFIDQTQQRRRLLSLG